MGAKLTEDRITTHDIEANGKTYIMEWHHSVNGEGYIAITETCDDPSNEDLEMHDHETYDFKEVL